jgi:hypothetical protein
MSEFHVESVSNINDVTRHHIDDAVQYRSSRPLIQMPFLNLPHTIRPVGPDVPGWVYLASIWY